MGMDETTQNLSEALAGALAGAATPTPQPALVVVWSAEPGRVGEVLLLGRGPRLLGRGPARADDLHPRLTPVRQRPGSIDPRAPFGSPGLSRAQLVLTARADGIDVEGIGRSGLWLDEWPVVEGHLRPGQVLRVGHQLVLLCVLRSSQWAPLRSWPASAWPAFGAPDAWGMVGESPEAWRVREACAFAAARTAHVLVSGPSGAGKELAAQAIHGLSGRVARPWVARNAATLPAGLIDAELFGNARNYPNPGMAARDGLVGAAERGTLFLDEIGEVPEAMQAHLLRLLDDGEYHRLGESQARKADVRVVAATNRDPAALKFDLRARFKLGVELPGFAARREDIPLVATALLRRAAARDVGLAQRFFDAEGNPRLSAELVAWLVCRPDYALNARELESLLWQAMAESPGEQLVPPASAASSDVPQPPRPATSAPADAGRTDPAELTVEDVRAALAACENNRSQAWRHLNLNSRYQLLRLLKKFGIDRT
jgi:two-component system nitrogen regulation response regulator GlnG/two-component system response regulator HydG